MKKIILILLLFFIITNVNALTPCFDSSYNWMCAEDQYCWSSSKPTSSNCNVDSYGNPLYCFKCQYSEAGLGRYLISDSFDCASPYVVEFLGENQPWQGWYSCSECNIGDHENWGEAIASSDTKCKNAGVNCSCIGKNPTSGSWYNYARWQEMTECSLCTDGYSGLYGSSQDCFTDDEGGTGGFICQLTSNHERKRCFANENEECCSDTDCSIQSNEVCDLTTKTCITAPSTTTTSSTTTTTYPGETTSTTTSTTSTSTTTTTLQIYGTCQRDINCTKTQYCETGWDTLSQCLNKKPSYLEVPEVQCSRNHECLSELCSAHSNNNLIGDYPPYTGDAPYTSSGTCLPSTYTINAVTQPEQLIKNNNFNIYAKLDFNGYPISATCKIYFAPIYSGNLIENNTAWAYNNEGNSYNTPHNMISTDYMGYNFITQYPLEINQTSAEEYQYGIICVDVNGNYAGFIGYSNVYDQNFTTIKVINNFPTNVELGDSSTLLIQYFNPLNGTIKNANCIINSKNSLGLYANFTLTEQSGSYYYNKVFNNEGIETDTVYCNKDGFTPANIILPTINTISTLCQNHIQDVGESGIDCGGNCPPCSIELLDDNGDCTSNTQCKSGWCYNNKCKKPSCSDVVKNQDETQTDCGGTICPICTTCRNNNECSNDGRAYCNTTGTCQIHNCTTQTDCYQTLDWYIPSTNTYISKPITCDTTDYLCKINTNESVTKREINAEIIPISGITANKSGSVIYIGNCQDQTNGLKINTKVPVNIWYSFATSNYNPSLTSNLRFRKVSEQTTTKTFNIPELCTQDEYGYGGIDEEVYANINLRLCITDTQCENYPIDFHNYQTNLKSSLKIFLNTTSQNNNIIYVFNSSTRNIKVSVKNYQTNKYQNTTANYAKTQIFNYSRYYNTSTYIKTYYFKIDTDEGETYSDQYGQPWMQILTYDENTHWFKLNIPIYAWFVPLILFILIIYGTYMNYKASRNKEAK